jgi:hypothetical protein
LGIIRGWRLLAPIKNEGEVKWIRSR